MSSPTISSTPADILLEVASHLNNPDLLSFCLTSKSFFTDIAPALYQCVVLNSTPQCTATLAMLKTRTDIARHVRDLVIRPSHNNNESIRDTRAVSVAVAELAASRCLESLAKFAWYDDEIAYHEEMWLALRMCCPRLRYLSTSIGSYFPSSSHLFNFTDLLGFSVILTPGFYENNTESFLDAEERPPSKKLWDMLFRRCPNLEELVIEGYSSFPADARCLVDGRWPNLRKLALGDISIDWDPPSPTTKGSFTTFLEAHPSLQTLALSRHNFDPAQLTSLDPSCGLKHLTSFSGTLPQLQALSHSPAHPHLALTSLTLRDPVWSRDVTTLALASALTQLPALASLHIAFMLHSPYDSTSILRALVAACGAQLQHLHLSYVVRVHSAYLQLDGLAKALPAFRRLRTFSLTLVGGGGCGGWASNSSIGSSLAGPRIALANPRLRAFTLACVPPAASHHPAPPHPELLDLGGERRARFALVCDAHGLPVALRVHERCATSPWGLGLGFARTRTRTRRYSIDLRPRRGKGVLSILGESSPAGEEMRMFVLCSVLVCFAGVFVVTG
ncbi:hypothetical protein C8R46DRAFT_978844 [Mycena filopes]|nr:hypothetical protein C8R46DRAFT_978844 [Mycena filopes]